MKSCMIMQKKWFAIPPALKMIFHREHSFVHSIVLSFVHSCVHSLIHSCIQSRTHSCLHSCIHLCMRAFIRALICAFIRALICARVHSFVHSLNWRWTTTTNTSSWCQVRTNMFFKCLSSNADICFKLTYFIKQYNVTSISSEMHQLIWSIPLTAENSNWNYN